MRPPPAPGGKSGAAPCFPRGGPDNNNNNDNANKNKHNKTNNNKHK